MGSFTPNQWGLYDMHGNVREWCWDWYDKYPDGPVTDQCGPAGASPGGDRVARGGSWYAYGQFLHSANRDWNSTSYRGIGPGFRLVRSQV